MLYEDNDYLIHFGIKGQHWGIRRFQNEDGSLTPEGQRQREEQYRQSDFNRGADAIRAVGNAIKQRIASSNVTKTKSKKETKAQEKARKEKAKKIMIAAGAVTLAAVAAYGIHKRGQLKKSMILKSAGKDIDLSSRRKQHKYISSIKRNSRAAKKVLANEHKMARTDDKIAKAQRNLEKIKQLQEKQARQLGKATSRFDRSNSDLLKKYGIK